MQLPLFQRLPIALSFSYLLLATNAFAQADNVLENASLNSGRTKQVGAVYRYSNVEPGLDVLVYLNSALPITLASFTATREDGVVDLLWITASEDDNDHFEVQRSVDAQHAYTILTVPAAGNSDRSQTYSTQDTNPLIGTSYYRLKQVDIDGQYTYSAWTKVVAPSKIGTIALYPNPVVGDKLLLTIEGTGSDKFEDIKVTDITGITREAATKIRDLLNRKQYEISTLLLEPGMYFVYGHNGQGSFAKSFVVH